MGQIIATCGHEVFDFKGYYWKQYDNEGDGLSYGGLCPKCIPIYHAVEASSWEDAQEKLKDANPIGLMDILQGEYGGEIKTNVIGGIPFNIYKVPIDKPREHKRSK